MARSRKSILGTSMMVIGGIVAALGLWNMFGVETIINANQNRLAEVTPLVLVEEQTQDRDLAVGTVFAKIRIPRFGENYVRSIAEGTSVERVLNTVGIGHYVSTAMPGEEGNFALAGHRSGNGGPMRNIDRLTNGDLAFVETAEKLFTYRFLASTVVSPNEVWVIDTLPKQPALLTSARKFLTLTTCTPIYVNTDRYVAWFEQIAEEPLEN